MADYVSREVARDNLRKTCRGGKILSAIVFLAGLLYAGIAAVIALDIALPFEFLYTALYVIVPTMADSMLALADCATKAFLLVLMGFLGLLMFGKISRTGEAFRPGQLKQLRFLALLTILLGFLPTLVGNGVKIALSIRQGSMALTTMSFAVEAMCILAGLLLFMACRVLVAGANLDVEQNELEQSIPSYDASEPDFADVPDLGSMPTAVPDEDVSSTMRQPPMV